LTELGRVTGIISLILFGFNVSLEAAHSADRLWIFKYAAWYALMEDEDHEFDEIIQNLGGETDFYI
jgi:hypothetical protein